MRILSLRPSLLKIIMYQSRGLKKYAEEEVAFLSSTDSCIFSTEEIMGAQNFNLASELLFRKEFFVRSVHF